MNLNAKKINYEKMEVEVTLVNRTVESSTSQPPSTTEAIMIDRQSRSNSGVLLFQPDFKITIVILTIYSI